MTYPSVISAVVRALASETMSGVGGSDFEPKVRVAKQRGDIIGREATFLVDCMVHARLRKGLSGDQWNVLVAKYSTHTERKHAAIVQLSRRVSSPAPERFRDAAVATWAIPKLPGVDGKRSTSVLPEAWYVPSNWCDEGRPDSTLRRWRNGIRKSLDTKVNEALVVAQEILDNEGLIVSRAA